MRSKEAATIQPENFLTHRQSHNPMTLPIIGGKGKWIQDAGHDPVEHRYRPKNEFNLTKRHIAEASQINENDIYERRSSLSLETCIPDSNLVENQTSSSVSAPMARQESVNSVQTQIISETVQNPVVCFYIRLEDASNVMHRAVYLANRSMSALLKGISTKLNIPLEPVGEIIYFNADFVQITVDEDVIRHLPDGQDMVMHHRSQSTQAKAIGTGTTTISYSAPLADQLATSPSNKKSHNARIRCEKESFQDLIDFEWEPGDDEFDESYFTTPLQPYTYPGWSYSPESSKSIASFGHTSDQVDIAAKDPSKSPLQSFHQLTHPQDVSTATLDISPLPWVADPSTQFIDYAVHHVSEPAYQKPWESSTPSISTRSNGPAKSSTTSPRASTRTQSTNASLSPPTSYATTPPTPNHRGRRIAHLPPEIATSVREKNRVAAQKCRVARGARTEQLEATSLRMSSENARLRALKAELEAEAVHLAGLVKGHERCCGEEECDGEHAEGEPDRKCDFRVVEGEEEGAWVR